MALAGEGSEWVVEAYGCAPAPLATTTTLETLFTTMIEELGLRPVAPPVWHQFPAPEGAATPGGVTGVAVLAESHLTVHTFPEHGSLCLNLFCCRPRPEWDYASELAALFGATNVRVRRLDRPYAAPPSEAGDSDRSRSSERVGLEEAPLPLPPPA